MYVETPILTFFWIKNRAIFFFLIVHGKYGYHLLSLFDKYTICEALGTSGHSSENI